MSSEQQRQAAPEGAASAAAEQHVAAVAALAEGLDLVTVIAEATDGVTVWYASESVPAHQYDGHDFVRGMCEASVRGKLAAEAPEGLPVTIRTDRWTMTLGSEDPA